MARITSYSACGSRDLAVGVLVDGLLIRKDESSFSYSICNENIQGDSIKKLVLCFRGVFS